MPCCGYVHGSMDPRAQMMQFGFGRSSLGFWYEVVRRQLLRLEGARDELADVAEKSMATGEGVADVDGLFAPFYYTQLWAVDAPYLVLAMRTVLVLSRKLNGRIRDPDLGRALRVYEQKVPNTEAFRHFVAHPEDYAFGTGKLPLKGPLDAYIDVRLADPNDMRSELLLTIGGEVLNISQGGRASLDLAAAGVAAWRVAFGMDD